jgi:hypothetical protein
VKFLLAGVTKIAGIRVFQRVLAVPTSMCRGRTVRDDQTLPPSNERDTAMKTKMRYLTTLLVATAATGLAIGFAPVAIADPGATSLRQGDTSGIDSPTGPGLWNGGSPAGGTGIYTGSETASGPSYWRGGEPAGGTGVDSGPDTGSGPGFWSGGESAGAIG